MAAAQQTSQGPPAAKLPFKMRLKAWWDGNDLLIKQPAAPEARSASASQERPPMSWTETRIDLAQKIWGEGFSSPGEEAYIMGLVKTLGLTPAMSVLDLGAGLGGASRVMAKNFGCWVTALEAKPELAQAGHEISTKAGMAKKAPVESFDAETIELKKNTYDVVFSQGALFTKAGKERLLQQVATALKDKGQFLFTDFVKADGVVDDGPISAWVQSEPVEPRLWSAEDYSRYIETLGLDVRVIEDISDRFKAMVLQGWAGFLSSIEESGLDHATGAALVSEIELWTRRIQILDSGQLRICRLHALKTGSLISTSED